MKTTVVYKRGENFEIRGDFYPILIKNRPVLVYIHGGGLLYGTREDIDSKKVKFYNSAGFNLFSIDYRLAPETKLQEIVEDVKSAFQWIEIEADKRFDFDKNKVAVVGSSAGGYLALLTGTFQKRPNAIVSFYGYGDITGDWAVKPSPHYKAMTEVPKELVKMVVSNSIITSGPIQKRYALYMYARQQGEWIENITGLPPKTSKELLSKYCPLFHVDKHYPPTLLLHGTMDEDVPYEQSVLMNKAINEAGSKSKLITIPGGKHVFDNDWQNPLVQSAYKEVIAFLNHHLKS